MRASEPFFVLCLVDWTQGVTLLTSGSCLHFSSLHKQKLVNSLPTQIILFFYEISCSLCEMYVTCFLMSPLLPTLSVKRTPVARCSHGRAELGASHALGNVEPQLPSATAEPLQTAPASAEANSPKSGIFKMEWSYHFGDSISTCKSVWALVVCKLWGHSFFFYVQLIGRCR